MLCGMPLPDTLDLDAEERRFLEREDVQDLPEEEQRALIRASRKAAFWPTLLSLGGRLLLFGGLGVSAVVLSFLSDSETAENRRTALWAGLGIVAVCTLGGVITYRRLRRLRAPGVTLRAIHGLNLFSSSFFVAGGARRRRRRRFASSSNERSLPRRMNDAPVRASMPFASEQSNGAFPARGPRRVGHTSGRARCTRTRSGPVSR